jgi:hypothetical protein
VMNADGTGRTLSQPEPGFSAAWSPDRRHIVYASSRDARSTTRLTWIAPRRARRSAPGCLCRRRGSRDGQATVGTKALVIVVVVLVVLFVRGRRLRRGNQDRLDPGGAVGSAAWIRRAARICRQDARPRRPTAASRCARGAGGRGVQSHGQTGHRSCSVDAPAPLKSARHGGGVRVTQEQAPNVTQTVAGDAPQASTSLGWGHAAITCRGNRRLPAGAA